MIPLPLLIAFAWLVTIAIATGAAYLKGDGHARAAMMARAAEAADRAIRRHNTATVEDIEAARLAAERAARDRLAAAQIRHRTQLEVLNGRLLTCSDAAPAANPGPPGNAGGLAGPVAPADPPRAAGGPVRVSAAGMQLAADAVALYNTATGAAGGSADPVPAHPGYRSDPGQGRPGAPAADRGDLRISYYLRLHPSRGGGVAAAAD